MATQRSGTESSEIVSRLISKAQGALDRLSRRRTKKQSAALELLGIASQLASVFGVGPQKGLGEGVRIAESPWLFVLQLLSERAGTVEQLAAYAADKLGCAVAEYLVFDHMRVLLRSGYVRPLNDGMFVTTESGVQKLVASGDTDLGQASFRRECVETVLERLRKQQKKRRPWREWVYERGEFTEEELGSAMAKAAVTVRENLRRLESYGIVKRTGPERWKVSDFGREIQSML